MSDWQYPEQDYYKIEEKLTQDKSLKLLKIAELQTYALVCLRIFYQYFHETNETIENLYWLLENLCSVKKIFDLKNQSFKTDLLKLVIVHWDSNDVNSNGYKTIKTRIMSAVDASEKSFFELAFLLHGNFIYKFEVEFEKYLTELKENFGDFHEYFVLADLPLLYVTMKEKKMFRSMNFAYKHCPYVKYDSTILRKFKMIQEYTRFFMVEDLEEPLVSSFLCFLIKYIHSTSLSPTQLSI